MPGPATISKSISGFDPRSVAGCQLWLDAIDTSAVTGSSPVTAWRDKSASGNNATYAGTPSISATAINGRQAIYFNGSSYFTGAISAASTTTITIFMVGSLISPFTGFSGLLCFGNPSQLDYDNAGSLPITMYNADFAIYGARNSSSQITPISANVPFLYVLQYDGTYINTWLNGTQQTNPSTNIASSGTFTYTNYSVSCRAGTITGQYIWTGYFGEILVYQSALTTTERQKVEGYLSWKWGLQNISQNFTPTSISGCLLWLDGADQSTNSMTLSGTSVSLWKDKTGNSTMTLGGTAPTLSTGPTGVYFPGTGYYSTTYTASPVNETLFIVFNTNSTLYTGYAPIIGASASGSRSFSLQNGSAILGYLSEAVAWGVTTTFTIGTITLAEGTYTGSTESVTINGGSFATGSQSFTAGRTSIIGAYPAGGSYFKGWIYEIIAYNSVLSTAQRQQVEIYLSRKWGVSVSTNALSLSHPFSSIRPFSRYFNPIDIQSCQLWLDAADSSTTGGGSTLSTWLDKSGNGNTATSGSGTIAVSSTGLTFNGSTNYMTVAGLAGALANTSFVVFVVETLTGSGGYYFGDDNVNNGGSTDSSLHIGYRSQTNQTFAFYGDDLEDTTVSGSNIRRVWAHWLPTGANRVTRRNGAVDVTLGNSNRLQYFTAPRIGRVFTGNYYTGTISEIIVYSTDIGIQNIYSVEGYLAWKWGLQTSLPATHPYKQFPPSSALPFSPTNLSNCQLWMDATQDTSANNATITTILDRSGNGTNLTAIGTITFYQNYRNGNPVYYFGGTRASNANFDWGTNFTHIVVSSSGYGSWLNSAGTLTTYVGLGNWALANINATISFEDPGSANSSANWTLTNGATVSVSNLVLSLSLTTTSGSRGQSTYGVVVNSVRETSFSFNFPSSGTNVTFGWTDGTTPITFLITTSGTTPTGITCPSSAGTVAITGSSGATVLVRIYNTSYYIIAYSSAASSITGSWTSSGGTYTIFFATSAASTAATTFNNVQFDPAQGGSILPKTTGLATAWNITSVGYTSGSTTLTNYAVNGITRSSWTSTAYSGQTPVLPLYINGSSTGAYDSTYYAEIIHYNVALSTAQRQQVEGYLAAKWGISLPTTHPYRNFQPAQTSFVIITPGTIATVTLSALSGSGGTITWTTSTNAVSYKWYVGTTYPTALTSGTVGAVLTTSVSYAFIASTNYYAWVIPVSSTGTDGATTQSAAASYSAGGGITVSSSGTAADMTAAANTISGSFAGVDDSFGYLPCISFGINGTSGYTTAYVGTNGYITFASGSGNIPSANTPSVPSIPAIKIRGFDSRGISCTYASGSKPSNANITYTRIVGNWYPYYGVNAGLIPLEIFLVRDATATKQYIWIKIGSSYNNNGYGDSDWAVTNGSSYLVSVAYPGAGTSIVFESSGFTGASWTATSPGSLVGLLT